MALTVSPNPASTQVTIAVDQQKAVVSKSTTGVGYIAEIQLTNIQGVLLRTTKYAPGSSQVSYQVADLSAGTYFLRVFDGRNWTTQKLMIAK